MMQLLDNYTYACKEATMSSVEREAWFHLKYEQIHPFIDGNGRTGRLLMFRGLLKDGMPPFVMNSDSRAKYIDIVSTQDKEELMSLIEESCKNEEARVNQLFA